MILNIGEDWRPDIKGWSIDILPFYDRMARHLPDGANVVEIGVYHGRSLLYLAERLWTLGKRNCKLYAVDTWGAKPTVTNPSETWTTDDLLAFKHNRISIGDAGSLVTVIQDSSLEAAEYFFDERIDFDLVFIDGAHDYESVKSDIKAWSPLVKDSGTLAGHDYWNWGEHAGVGRAVDEIFSGVTTRGSVWLVEPHGNAVRDELVSVVIPCKGQAKFLREAVESVWAQTYRNIEIVIATGDEESIQLATSFVGRKSLTIVSDCSKGRSHAINSAIALARGKYILRLDADDKLSPTTISKLVAATPPDEPYAITTCNLQHFGSRTDTLTTAPFFAYNQLNDNFIISGSLFARKLWEDAHGFSVALCHHEDWGFWISTLPLLPVVSKVNLPLYHYRIHEDQGMAFASQHDAALRAMVRIAYTWIFHTSQFQDYSILKSAKEPLKIKIRTTRDAFPEDTVARLFGGIVGPAPKPSTICLVMICKDEERVIRRALDSVKTHIDAWVIVDTGSTDRTKEIILEWGERNVPGFLLSRPWVNFGHNRTEAIQEAGRLFPGIDYLLILDADDTIEASPETFKHLTNPAYQIRLKTPPTGNPTYWKIHLIRPNQDWRYEGATHEALVSPSGIPVSCLEGPTYWCNNDGASNVDQKAKFLRDAELLEKQHQENPGDLRTIFYLAQSYRDAGNTGAALKNYQLRAKSGGWDEEVYLSLHNIALISEGLGLIAQTTHAYLQAWNARPWRAEPLYRLARIHAARKEWPLAYLFARQARLLPFPAHEVLFVDKSVYAWRALDEYALACSWTDRHKEAIHVWRDLIQSGNLPVSEHGRVQEYLRARREHGDDA